MLGTQAHLVLDPTTRCRSLFAGCLSQSKPKRRHSQSHWEVVSIETVSVSPIDPSAPNTCGCTCPNHMRGMDVTEYHSTHGNQNSPACLHSSTLLFQHHRCTACCVIIWELAVLVHLNLTSCPNHKLYLLERLDQFRTRDGIEYDDLQAWSKTDGDALELVDW